MQIKIEHSASGKTFGVAFYLKDGDKPNFVIKGCRIANGKDGDFVSGPSTKMDDGKWLNYAYFDQNLSEYILKEYQKDAPKKQEKPQQQGGNFNDFDDDIPF